MISKGCDSTVFVEKMEDRMPWNDITRKQHNRDGLRYPSDLTDAEWALVSPFIPPSKPGGRPRKTDMREVMNGILYIVSVVSLPPFQSRLDPGFHTDCRFGNGGKVGSP